MKRRILLLYLCFLLVCCFSACLSIGNKSNNQETERLRNELQNVKQENENLKDENEALKNEPVTSIIEEPITDNPTSNSERIIQEDENGKALAEFTSSSGIYVYRLPLECSGNNILFSDERFDIEGLTYKGMNNDYGTSTLIYSGKFKSKDDYAYQAIVLTFALIDKKDEVNTDFSAGMVSIEDVRMGDEKDFMVELYVSDYSVENAKYVALTGITTF